MLKSFVLITCFIFTIKKDRSRTTSEGEKLVDNNNTLLLDFTIERGNFLSAGDASSKIKKVLQSIGLENALIRKISIATYEAEMNLVIHSVGGTISAFIDRDKVKIKVEDKGPGIEDIDLAMTEGFSTATNEIREMGFGAGMGLPNIKKCSDDFHIDSTIDVGTKISMVFNY